MCWKRRRLAVGGARVGQWRLAAAAMSAVVFLAGCQAVGGLFGGAAVDNTVTGALSPADAVRAVSAYRRSKRRGPVVANEALNRAARAYVAKLARAGRLTHRLNGSTLPRRLAAVGYEWDAAAENLGAGYRSLDHAMHGWKTSRKGHNEILLRQNVTELGFAMATTAKGRYRSYWVLVLASPAKRGKPRAWIQIPHP